MAQKARREINTWFVGIVWKWRFLGQGGRFTVQGARFKVQGTRFRVEGSGSKDTVS